MSGALNALVKGYLDTAHPSVARIFAKEASIDEVQCRRLFQSQTLEALVRKHATKRLPVEDDSSEDEAPPKKAPRKASPKPAPKKAPVPDSSSDDDEPTHKPAPRKASPKPAPKKAPVPDSSSDDDEPVHKPTPTAEPPAKVPRQVGSSGPSANRNPDGTYKRFQRIDPTKVAFVHDALRDNRPGQEHLVLRQNQEMMRVKGKDFNKLKQKNKGKFYGAGVDLSVRSYQFPDSDDE